MPVVVAVPLPAVDATATKTRSESHGAAARSVTGLGEQKRRGKREKPGLKAPKRFVDRTEVVGSIRSRLRLARECNSITFLGRLKLKARLDAAAIVTPRRCDMCTKRDGVCPVRKHHDHHGCLSRVVISTISSVAKIVLHRGHALRLHLDEMQRRSALRRRFVLAPVKSSFPLKLHQRVSPLLYPRVLHPAPEVQRSIPIFCCSLAQRVRTYCQPSPIGPRF
jgi:hypothetical protein